MNNLEETGLTELNSTELKETEGGLLVSYIAATDELLVSSGDEYMVVSGSGISFYEAY